MRCGMQFKMDSVTRKLHQATRRSPARGTSECLVARLHNGYVDVAEFVLLGLPYS